MTLNPQHFVLVFFYRICYSDYLEYYFYRSYGGDRIVHTMAEKELFVGRTERKYRMEISEARKLQKELDLLLKRDTHSQNGPYRVKSLYFDSYRNIDYTEKLGGFEKRRKIRLRLYDENASRVKLEIKQKQGDYQHKCSLILSRQEAQRMMDRDYAVLLSRQEETAYRIYNILMQGGYRPVAIVEYDRTAYVYENYVTRITFDADVRSEELALDLFQRGNYRRTMGEAMILEVKYNGCLAGFISSVLSKYSLTQTAVSKYAGGRPLFAEWRTL